MLTRAAGWAAAILLILVLGAGHAPAYPIAKSRTFDRPAAAFPDAVAFSRGHYGSGAFSRYHSRSHPYSERSTRSFLTHRQAASRAKEGHQTSFPRWRRSPGNRLASTSGQPADPPRIPPRGGNHPRPPRDPGNSDIWWPIRRPAPLSPVASTPAAAAVVALPAAAAIAGFGGSRPPIAPRFSRGQGQPSSVAAALLNNKRHR